MVWVDRSGESTSPEEKSKPEEHGGGFCDKKILHQLEGWGGALYTSGILNDDSNGILVPKRNTLAKKKINGEKKIESQHSRGVRWD